MSAATIAAGSSAVVGRRTVAELVRAESRYVLRNPVLWLGTAVYGGTAVLPAFTGQGSTTSSSDLYLTYQFSAGALALAAFLVAVWAAQRERPATTAELFVNTPARRWERTVGLLGAVVVPFGLALVIGCVQLVVIQGLGGIPVGDEPWRADLVPTPLELLGAPLAVACSFVAGIAVVRLVRSRAVAALLGVVASVFLFLAFWIWYIVPFALVAVFRTALTSRELGAEATDAELSRFPAASEPDQHQEYFTGIDRDLGFYALHLLFVVGLTVMLAGIALLRSGPDRRSWRILAAGLVTVVLSVLAQLLFVEGARNWMGFL
jgi:ABC-type transport system involved in multi-copper enzyme maturation permease subunit